MHVGFIGSVLAMGGALVAEIADSDLMSQGGLWVGMAGVVTAIGAVIRDYWTDRQKARDHEILKMRITQRSDQNTRVILSLWRWSHAVSKTLPTVVPPPDLPPGFEESGRDEP